MIEAGLDIIRISVEHVSDEGYRTVTRVFTDYALIVANVATLYPEKTRRGSPLHIHCKILDTGLSEAKKQRFFNDFGPISDSLKIGALMGWTDNAGVDWTLGHEISTGMDGVSPLNENFQVCPSPFKTLAINSTAMPRSVASTGAMKRVSATRWKRPSPKSGTEPRYANSGLNICAMRVTKSMPAATVNISRVHRRTQSSTTTPPGWSKSMKNNHQPACGPTETGNSVVEMLADDWRRAGIGAGDTVLIHSSLKRTLRRLLKQ